MAQEAEKQKLLDVVVASHEAQTMNRSTKGVPATDPSVERAWDGHILQCCGSCDRHGCSAFASTLLCMPCTVAHNMKSALPGVKWCGLVTLLILSLSFSFMYSSQMAYRASVCHPPGPLPDLPKPHGPDHPEPKGIIKEPSEEKIFLAGATFNPELLKDLPASKGPEEIPEAGEGFKVMVGGQPIEEFEKTNGQIQLAKSQAMEGMNQVQLLGRKLLHKHHDDDDDDDKPKKKGKKCKKHNKEEEDDHDKHHGLHAETFDHRRPEDGPPRPNPVCEDAETALAILGVIRAMCWLLLLVAGWRMRTRIRERFNIKGSPARDWCAWWCCMPCAICQETRTLTKNNVVNGVWDNAAVYRAPVLALPPSSEETPVPSYKLVEV